MDGGPDAGGLLEGELALDDLLQLGGGPEGPLVKVGLEYPCLARVQGDLQSVRVALRLLARLDQGQFLALARIDVDHHPDALGQHARSVLVHHRPEVDPADLAVRPHHPRFQGLDPQALPGRRDGPRHSLAVVGMDHRPDRLGRLSPGQGAAQHFGELRRTPEGAVGEVGLEHPRVRRLQRQRQAFGVLVRLAAHPVHRQLLALAGVDIDDKAGELGHRTVGAALQLDLHLDPADCPVRQADAALQRLAGGLWAGAHQGADPLDVVGMDHRPSGAAGLLEAHRTADQGLELRRAPEGARVVVDLEHPRPGRFEGHLQALGVELRLSPGGDQRADVAAVHDVADQLPAQGLEGPVLALDPAHPSVGVEIGLLLLVQQGGAFEHPPVEIAGLGRDVGEQFVKAFAEARAVRPAGRVFPCRARGAADAVGVVQYRRALRDDRRPAHLLEADLGEILEAIAGAGRLLIHGVPGPRRQNDVCRRPR